MGEKSKSELRVKETIIQPLYENQNMYIPYKNFMEAFFGNKYLVMMRKFKKQINLIEREGIKYFPVLQLTFIFKESEEEEIKQSIMSQVFKVSKPREKYINKVMTALDTLAQIKRVYELDFERVHDFDLKECDLKHEIENEEFNQGEAYNLIKEYKEVRLERRKIKDRLKIYKHVIDFIDKNNLDVKEMQRYSAKMRNEKEKIELSKKHKIYFKRDSSNKEEMENKLNELKKHFNIV
ncbi:hypothetical protein FDC49_18400 [Clostridium sporogenes]|uniref:hypothetical protein n=1 Tax=Clostridium sporogenes TaxID=1509 RepID=UPI0013D5AF77|nr:hypothetical protein [Clostridium sporogenes]NFH33600.1 hypothetical protein [Clostridium sporogenes]NFL21672.1 hypothetical protein [Clostridium sporogenes]NFN75098.1 hypothetical protein [Clostridium sporogenes]NFV22857.1 hypothetical protein [Clostridium sporogenes]